MVIAGLRTLVRSGAVVNVLRRAAEARVKLLMMMQLKMAGLGVVFVLVGREWVSCYGGYAGCGGTAGRVC